jgi:Tol biopolymer transport system component/DNA-binding winged helix-turn-helix (wHTH) protein
MAASSGASPRDPIGYTFGDFLVDPVRRLIWRNNRVIALSGKTFDLLLILLRHRTRTIEKDELLTLIWPDAIVQENNLTRQMSNLRRALGQRPDQHDIIVTVPGRGYRFVAETAELERLPRHLVYSAEPSAHAAPALDPSEVVARELANSSAVEPAAENRSAVPARRSTTLVGLIVAAALVALAVYSMRPHPVMGAPRTLRQLTYDAGLQQQPSWAPDGQRFAYAANVGQNSDIWLQSTNDPTPRRLTTSPATDWQPAWSPDGARLAFRSEREASGLYVVSVAGGDETRVSDFGFRPQWSPNGRSLLFDDMDAEGPKRTPYIVQATGGSAERFRPDLTDSIRLVTAAWHPDGRVSLLSREGGIWRFLTAPVGPGSAVSSNLLPNVVAALEGVDLGRFVWAKSGRFVFVEGRARESTSIWRITIDPATLAWMTAERVTTAAGREGDLALSADGSRLAFTSLSETTRLWSLPYDPKTGRVVGEGTPVTSGGAGEFDAAVPPEGTRLAYRTLRINRQEMWERAIDTGRDRLLLASEDGRFTSPRWSRDGTRLAYARRPAATGYLAQASVAILTIDSGREQLFSVAAPDRFVPDDWSPDGSLLLGACSTGGLKRLGTCVLPVKSTEPTAPVKLLASDLNRDLICQRFSPDQHWISFMANDGPRSKVSTLYVMPTNGGTWIPITNGEAYDDKPRWSGDGRTIFFLSDRDGLLNLWARRFDPVAGRPIGEPYRVTSFDEMQHRLPSRLAQIEIAVSNDRVFLPISESTGRIWILDHVDR